MYETLTVFDNEWISNIARLVEKLLETEAKGDVSVTDRQGRTPLQSLEEKLTSDREFLRTFGIPFTGHPQQSIRTKDLLLSTAPQLVSSDESNQLAFGCTCGQCLHGFLSPRMKLRLQGGSYSKLAKYNF